MTRLHLIATLTLLLAACSPPAPDSSTSSSPSASVPSADAYAPAAGIRRVTILHTNDLHARLLPDDRGTGGFAQMTTAIAREKAKSPSGALVLHAGDFVQGTPVSTLFRGLPVIEVANRMGFDVHTLGNHEFDYGWERTREFIDAGEFATISANVVDRSGNTLADPYVVREVNGLRIGVIGVVTEQLDNLTRAVYRGPWDAAPLVKTVRRYAAELEDQTDLLVVLAHCFDDEDDRMLAELTEIPVIIGGHNHGGADDVKARDGRLVVKVRAYGRELGRLDLDYDADNKRLVGYDWRRIEVTAKKYPADPEVQALVDKWEAKVAEKVDETIGRSTMRMGKRELRPLIERVMREETGADFAYMNEGGIRDNLRQGEITRRHIWNMLPFGNTIYAGDVRGRDLPNELRNLPNINPNKTYRIATNSFIAEKWAERGIRLTDQQTLVRDALIDAISARRTVP